MESPLTPRSTRPRGLLSSIRGSGKFNTPNKGNQAAQIVYKSLHNTVESFGLPLPVLVTETLTFADSNAQISSRLSPEGWGWIICGRRLLIWQYHDRRQRGSSLTPISNLPVTCYELTLPQTDLAHKADLVCVYTTEGNQTPSCTGISPEGVVRYWHSIAHDGGYVEKTADLHGQECDLLVDANPIGCVLATTTCTVVLIQSNISGGRHNISVRTLQGSGGWLGGLSRRVSSLFFSAMPSSQPVETKLVGALSLGEYDGVTRVCVVAGLCAQLWHLGSPEKLIVEIDLQRTLRDAFLHASMFPPGDPASLDVHIIDMQSWKGGLLLLAGAVNTMRSPQMRYALAHVCTNDEGGAGQLLSLVPLQVNFGNTNRFGNENTYNDPNLVATSTKAYLYDKSRITIVSCVTPNDKPDVIELNSSGDQILGAGLRHGVPLFFSKVHGVISAASNDKLQDLSLFESPIPSPRPSDMFDGHLSLYEIDPKAVVEASENAGQGSTAELLKAAFLHHMRREHTASRTLLNELFPPGEEIADIDSPLDRAVYAIATDLVNDIPSNDPRWSQAGASSGGAALGSSSSMQIGLQLQDKRRAYTLLLEFLRASGLWSRLGGATANSIPTPTVLLLRGIAEKLTAAIALRSLQQQPQHQQAIDTAIQKVMVKSAEEDEEETIKESAALSASDLFYKQVSKIERIIIHAANWCSEQDISGCALPALSQLIAKVNNVIITVLQEVLKYRHQHLEFYIITPMALKLHLEHVTWTSTPKANCLQSALRSQQALSVRRARRAPIELRGELKSQAASLAAAALEFARERIEIYPAECKRKETIVKEYEQMRTEMIQPLVDDGDYEHASNLAEKFHDFDILVSICEKTNNREKLYQYMDKYENLGFHQCAFKWFMNKGRGGQAMLLKAFPHHGEALSQWLSEQGAETQEYIAMLDEDLDSEMDEPIIKPVDKTTQLPADGSELLWLHELRAEKWLQSADTLIQLSENETESVNRMTIQASLGKLCAYAAEDERENRREKADALIEATNCRLLLAEHHNLPPQLLTTHGLEGDNLRVMEPRDIIDMFITSSGNGLTEYDYSRALSLCDLVNNIDQDVPQKDIVAELRRRLWCSTILIDDWDKYDVESPLTAIENMMFFKVIHAVHVLYTNIEDYLVSLDVLLSSKELKELHENKKFQYLIKYGYEHLYQAREGNEMECS